MEKCSRSFGISRIVVNENPQCAPIVWQCLRTAIQNAVHAVEGWDVQDLGEMEREVFAEVVRGFVASCFATRAIPVLSALRKLYNGTPFLLLGPNFVSFRVLVQRIKAAPPVALNTKEMDDLY
jgi:hypothetical protein